MNHALKIEELSLTKGQADKIKAAMLEFLQELGHNEDRIEAIECRHRDGFIPYSDNKGGLEGSAYLDQNCLPNGSLGFKNADATIEKYQQMDRESFAEEKGFKEGHEWTDENYNDFDEWQSNGDSDSSSILLSTTLKLTSETELNIRLCVCVKDAPYHRSYDDKLEFNIKFTKISDLRAKLAKLLEKRDVMKFSQNLQDSY